MTTDSKHQTVGAMPGSGLQNRALLQALITALMLVGVGADAMLEQGVASGVFYVALVALTAWWPGIRSTLGIGAVASALTLLGYFISPPGGELWKAVVNRLLALFAIWITAALVVHHKRLNTRSDLATARAARSELQFRATFQANPSAMLLVDRHGLITTVNPEVERLFGYASGELIGQSIENLVPEADRTAHAQHRATLAEGDTKRPMGVWREIDGVDKQGRAIPLEIGLSRIVTADGECVLATLTDLGDRKRLWQARESQLLAQRLLQADEALRKRLAREIHDALGQGLTALKLDIGWLAGRLLDAQENLRLRVAAMEEQACSIITDVRRLSAELRPDVLDDHGLLAAMRWQVGDFEKRFGLLCTLVIPDTETQWDNDRSTVVYRVLQESLTNVIRHAQASKVAISFRHDERGAAVLEVRDDGRGFNPAQADRPDALGLRGMRERALLHGGSLTVTAEPGTGTTVTLSMPTGSNPSSAVEEGS
jgi:PAS domain S-box-containing protein